MRDIQFIDWITKRHFGTRTLADLISKGFLQEIEYNHLRYTQEYLWKIRFSLQLVTKRREERLLFDHQIELARASGYNNLNSNLAVEQFMQNYYRHIGECSQLVELLQQHFEETCLPTLFRRREKPLNNRFVTRGDVLHVANKNVFQRYPMALLELFLLMQQNDRLTKVSSDTIRAVRSNLHHINVKFRNDIRNKSLFIEILRQPKHLSRELKRMHRYGVLPAYWPAFERIVGRMQYDLYHAYTVDHHILTVLKEACRFATDKDNSDTHAIYNQLPKPELLHLAALFHDIAKGRQGDHSTEGSRDAIEFCLAHGLSQYDASLVAWLVENHLEMSMTAQHKDTSDPEVLQEFTGKVSNLIRLNYLYLLTIADIKGTNPKLWNNWRATLLFELYKSTAARLREDLAYGSEQIIDDLKTSALTLLADYGHSKQDCETFWQEFGSDYFLRHSDDEIAWHTHAALSSKDIDKTQVRIRQLTSRGCTEIFIYGRDRRHLFTDITKKQSKHIEQSISRALQEEHQYSGATSQFIPRRLRHFHAEPKVQIQNSAQSRHSSLHVQATDYPGLLARIAHVLAELDIKVHSARVSTLGERVHDIFYVTSSDGKKITDEELKEKLVSQIKERIILPTEQSDNCINI